MKRKRTREKRHIRVDSTALVARLRNEASKIQHDGQGLKPLMEEAADTLERISSVWEHMKGMAEANGFESLTQAVVEAKKNRSATV